MISQNQSKRIRSLHQEKYRDQYRQFIIEGVRSVGSAIQMCAQIDLIIYTQDFTKKNPKLMIDIGPIPSAVISSQEIKALSPSTSPSGILAVCNIPAFESLNNNKNVIYLDCISDPGNFGTILRTAIWFGIDQIGLSPGCIDPFNPKVVRSAMGAHFNLSWMGELSLSKFEGYILVGADHRGEPITSLDPIPKKWALIMGSESHGFSVDVQSSLNKLVAIPKIGEGESLNVGVSMGILLYELTK